MTNYTQYQSVTLDNGLRIVHRTSDSPVMYCGFMVDCGTRDEKGPEMYGMRQYGAAGRNVVRRDASLSCIR